MASEFTFEGEYRFEEYLDCHEILASRRRVWVHAIVFAYGLGLLGYGVFHRGDGMPWVLLSVALILILFPFVISPFLFRYRVKKIWNRYPRVHKPIEVHLSAEGIQSRDDQGNLVHLDWDNYVGWKESPANFLIYLSPLQPQIYPKRLLVGAEIGEFRDFLAGIFNNREKSGS